MNIAVTRVVQKAILLGALHCVWYHYSILPNTNMGEHGSKLRTFWLHIAGREMVLNWKWVELDYILRRNSCGERVEQVAQ